MTTSPSALLVSCMHVPAVSCRPTTSHQTQMGYNRQSQNNPLFMLIIAFLCVLCAPSRAEASSSFGPVCSWSSAQMAWDVMVCCRVKVCTDSPSAICRGDQQLAWQRFYTPQALQWLLCQVWVMSIQELSFTFLYILSILCVCSKMKLASLFAFLN